MKLLPAIIIVGSGFASYILMNNEVKLLRRDLESLREQVTRQYGTQREMNEKTNREVNEIEKWVEFEKGKQSVERWKMQQNHSQTEK